LQENERSIKELTSHRPLATVPFAGRYRLIDFVLSSMVNSGLENVGVLLPNKSRSVMDHLRSGKDWDLARKRDGLRFLPPSETVDDVRTGDIQSLMYHLDYIETLHEEYVIIAGGSVIYNMSFDELFRYHENTKADITVVYTEDAVDYGKKGDTLVLQTADDGLVTDMAVVPAANKGEKVSMTIYIMRKDVFVNIVKKTHARGGTKFVFDGIVRNFEDYTIYGYHHKGYVARVNSLVGYYRASMDLLKDDKWQSLFINDNLIYTQVKDEAPVKYKRDAVATNSLIANGCVIEGTVENCILFRGVKVAKGAHIKNSIIMQKTTIAEGADLENIICDKNVVITENKCLKGAKTYPLVVEKGIAI
jgi:glucose-1-phosphate adenylyltransferase